MAAEASTVVPAAPGGFPAGLRPLLLLVGVAAAVAAGLTIALWWRGPSYSLLYANLSSEDQAQIAQTLDAAQIPYRLQPGSNAIEVASDRLTDARLKLAGQGLPESSGGFAALDKDPGFGVSQFVENARYQHALETELARTIASLKPVEAARVHLAVPRQSAFVREHHGASASVFVQLKAGRRLAQEQVQAVINLVASSIPELEPGQVTVVDQQGRLLSTPDGHDEFSLREQQFDMAHRLEDDYRARVESLLAPLVGAGRVRAQVVAQMDMSVTEEAREQYRPDSQIVRSEQTSEQTTRDGGGSQGVPGALSNQPPPAGVAGPPSVSGASVTAQASAANGAKPAAGAAASANAPAAAGAAGALSIPSADSSSKETTRNYEIDRTLAYTRQPAGKLKRLTVAVLIDDAHSTDRDGKPHTVALSQEQLDHVTQLVKDAVGFDESRGDVVNVVNSSFTEEPPAPAGDLEKPSFWEQPLLYEVLKIVFGAIMVIVLTLTVLRPLMKSLLASLRTSHFAAQAADAPTLPGPAPSPTAALQHEQQLAQARTLVTQDPKRVAQVVREWVDQDA